MPRRFLLPPVSPLWPLLLLLGCAPAAAAPATPRTAHPAPRPAPRAAAPKAPAGVTPANLAATLKGLGLATVSQDGYQRLQVQEAKFGYLVDLRFSESGEWLVCMAHLAPIPDLSKVPATPLLALLSTNDTLLGLSFSYNRASGQLMLNESLPAKGLTPAAIQTALQRLRGTVLETQGLWDPARW